MTKESLDAAIAEAKRFIAKAAAVNWRKIEMAHGGFHNYVESGVAAAAAKRASMDLTRALARMRRAD